MATKLSEKKKVLVGMSGGIDSSAVCMLLQDQGYEVLGITLRMWDIPSHFSTPGQKEPDHVLEARSLAERLAIPHYTLDVRDEFRKTVVQSFIDEYLRARTPNPCVMCNLYFKWKYMLDEADPPLYPTPSSKTRFRSLSRKWNPRDPDHLSKKYL